MSLLPKHSQNSAEQAKSIRCSWYRSRKNEEFKLFVNTEIVILISSKYSVFLWHPVRSPSGPTVRTAWRGELSCPVRDPLWILRVSLLSWNMPRTARPSKRRRGHHHILPTMEGNRFDFVYFLFISFTLAIKGRRWGGCYGNFFFLRLLLRTKLLELN